MHYSMYSLSVPTGIQGSPTTRDAHCSWSASSFHGGTSAPTSAGQMHCMITDAQIDWTELKNTHSCPKRTVAHPACNAFHCHQHWPGPLQLKTPERRVPACVDLSICCPTSPTTHQAASFRDPEALLSSHPSHNTPAGPPQRHLVIHQPCLEAIEAPQLGPTLPNTLKATAADILKTSLHLLLVTWPYERLSLTCVHCARMHKGLSLAAAASYTLL
jgi:hypothetical protein